MMANHEKLTNTYNTTTTKPEKAVTTTTVTTTQTTTNATGAFRKALPRMPQSSSANLC